MNMISPKEELKKRLRGESIGVFPRSIPVFTPVVDMMKGANAYFPDANYKARPMARLALAAHTQAGWNATMLPWASTVEMEALGCEVLNREDDPAAYPQFKKKAFSDAYDLTFGPDILTRGSLPAVFEATRILRGEIETRFDGAIPIVSMFQGPFTVASYAVGVNEMYRHMIRDVKRARKALDVVSDLSIMYAKEMLKSGGDVVTMSDPAAEGLTAGRFADILLPVYRKISGALECEKILHICGRTEKIAPHLVDSGFDGFSFDSAGADIGALREALGGRMRLVGSVPTVSCLLEGSEEDVVNSSLDMIARGTDILSPSCGLPQYTPLANVRALSRAIDAHNREGTGRSR